MSYPSLSGFVTLQSVSGMCLCLLHVAVLMIPLFVSMPLPRRPDEKVRFQFSSCKSESVQCSTSMSLTSPCLTLHWRNRSSALSTRHCLLHTLFLIWCRTYQIKDPPVPYFKLKLMSPRSFWGSWFFPNITKVMYEWKPFSQAISASFSL